MPDDTTFCDLDLVGLDETCPDRYHVLMQVGSVVRICRYLGVYGGEQWVTICEPMKALADLSPVTPIKRDDTR